jgi:hypothetical protein
LDGLFMDIVSVIDSGNFLVSASFKILRHSRRNSSKGLAEMVILVHFYPVSII